MATSEFGKAFAAARKSGSKEFEFNGKKYNTRTADDGAKDKKASYESAQRSRSDMMKALTAAERNAPAETTPLARQKIAEAKASVARRYGTAGNDMSATGATVRSMDTDVMRTASRTAAKDAGQSRKASAESAAKAGDKKTFGALNRTETNRSQRETAMRDDKASYKNGGMVKSAAKATPYKMGGMVKGKC
jgi:hypothetical protein